jgi:hypothetical protein
MLAVEVEDRGRKAAAWKAPPAGQGYASLMPRQRAAG